MKKPKIAISAPCPPFKPIEPVKERLQNCVIKSLYVNFNEERSIDSIIKDLEITDLNTKFKFSKNTDDYYDSEVYGFTIEIWGEKSFTNIYYDNDFKRYKKLLIDYERKLKEYNVKKQAYDKEYNLYLDKLEEYNLWYHQDQLDRIKKKRKLIK